MTEKELKIQLIKNRIALLESRTGKDNKAIIRKLNRRLKHLDA